MLARLRFLTTGDSIESVDNSVGELRRADSGWVVGARLQVVGHALALGDHARYRALQAVRRLALAQVPQHHHAGQHRGGWVDLVLTGVLRGAAVDRLEDGPEL